MDFRLKVFHSVATNLSFTKASKELFISQPAISKHIHELEVQYKTPLFDRVGSKYDDFPICAAACPCLFYQEVPGDKSLFAERE